MNTAKLQKKEDGKTLVWESAIKSNKFVITFGQLGGKMQTREYLVSSGKNIGKKNETSPEQQALFNMEVKIRKQVEKGYEIVNGYQFQNQSKTFLLQSSTAVKPMLAHEYEKHKKKIKTDSVFIQPKLDGVRCLYNVKTSELVSRNGKPIFGMEHIIEELQTVTFDDSVEWLDGELYLHGENFESISSATRRTKNISNRKMQFHVFDVVSEKGFFERTKAFPFLIGLKNVTVVQHSNHPNDESKIEEVHDQYVSLGYEGIMIRLPGIGYEHKRSYSLLKYKKFIQEEFVVIGFSKEEFEETLGAVVLQSKDKKTFEARPAMTNEQKKHIWENQSDFMNNIATVKFQERTEYGVPRFPVLLGFRHKDDM